MFSVLRGSAAAVALLLLAAGPAHAQPRSLEECAAAHPAAWGQAGKDVVWVPTSDAVVRAMLSMANVTPEDRVLDLGAGDGKIPIFAAKAFGARAVGIEYDPGMAKLAECLVRVAGVTDKVRIIEGDIFKEDFGDASVVTMYLLPHLNLCVRHRLLAMAPGTRVVSHHYAMAEWKPDESVQITGRDVRLWIVPARVDGVWDFSDSGGTPFTISLRQDFGALTGEVTRAGAEASAVSGTLRGVELRFTFTSDAGPVKFSGTVRGGEITGVLSTGTTAGTTARTASGRLRGALRAAPWAEMPRDCKRYYGG
jgi:SAM-dependent methyltransferase